MTTCDTQTCEEACGTWQEACDAFDQRCLTSVTRGFFWHACNGVFDTCDTQMCEELLKRQSKLELALSEKAALQVPLLSCTLLHCAAPS